MMMMIIMITTHSCTVIQKIQKKWGENLGELEIHSSGSRQWGRIQYKPFRFCRRNVTAATFSRLGYKIEPGSIMNSQAYLQHGILTLTFRRRNYFFFNFSTPCI